jgi:DNA polymerase III delta prime subunit
MFGRHPDVAVLDSGGDSIKTSDIGMLQEHFSMMSGEGLRIGIIMNADRMTIEAANRALKTLEEPSSQVRVILTSSRPLLLPATILGRCLRWRVRPPTRDEVLPWFKHLLQQRGRSMPADDVLDQWAMRLRFSPGLLKKEVEDDTDHVFGVQQEIRQLLNASEPSGVVRAAANLARQSKAKVPEIIEALEWELNCKWRQLLAHGVAPLDQVKRVAINADRRRMIANIRKQAIMGKVTLNAQLVAESVGLVSWGGSDK